MSASRPGGLGPGQRQTGNNCASADVTSGSRNLGGPDGKRRSRHEQPRRMQIARHQAQGNQPQPRSAPSPRHRPDAAGQNVATSARAGPAQWPAKWHYRRLPGTSRKPRPLPPAARRPAMASLRDSQGAACGSACPSAAGSNSGRVPKAARPSSPRVLRCRCRSRQLAPLRRQKRHQEHSGQRRQQQGQRRHVPAPARMRRAQALASAPHDPDQQRAGQQGCEQCPGKHGVIGQDALQGQYDQSPHRLLLRGKRRPSRQSPVRQHGTKWIMAAKISGTIPMAKGQMRYRRRATPARSPPGQRQGQATAR